MTAAASVAKVPVERRGHDVTCTSMCRGNWQSDLRCDVVTACRSVHASSSHSIDTVQTRSCQYSVTVRQVEREDQRVASIVVDPDRVHPDQAWID